MARFVHGSGSASIPYNTMPKFVIGSVYLLKNKTKMHYLGDQAGVLHFKDLKSGETYSGLPVDVQLETAALGNTVNTVASTTEPVVNNTTTSASTTTTATVSTVTPPVKTQVKL